MPTIKMNKRRFIQLLGKRLDDDELSYHIAMIGTDLEEINENEIIVEVFPNRPDMLSEEGFSRSLRYFLGLENEIKRYEVKKSTYSASLEEKALKVRPFVRCAVVKNVEFDSDAYDSLIALQEKLHITHGRKRKVGSIGVHDLDKISFPLRYIGVKEDFQFIPLGWDKEATIKEILRDHDKGKEYGHLLKDVKHYPVWIDSKNNVLALPPIINGSISAISSKTKNFFIDVTGTNESVVEELLNIVVTHLAELGGEVYEVKVNNHTSPDLKYRKKKVEIQYVNSLLGLNLNLKHIEELLLRMGLGIERINEKEFYALIPPYRTDILHPIDIVEDIAIAYHYDKFKGEIPNISTIANLHPHTIFEETLREIFSGLKAQEVITYHLSNEKILYKNMHLTQYKPIKVIHPMNEEYDILRWSILPTLLDFLSHNTRYEYPQFIFEMGRIFSNPESIEEKTSLGWAYAHTKIGFADARAIIDALMRELGVIYTLQSYKPPFLVPGRGVKIIIDNTEIGYFGEIHPKVIREFNIEVPIIGGEIYVEELYKKIKK